MCGIVGILAKRPVADLLVDGLRRLEYRGYDSAGIATIDKGQISLCRAEGKMNNLAARLAQEPLFGCLGIGHTRWATHGKPTEENAHPHATERVAVVHNGIIENHRELKIRLEGKGHVFKSETDTETIAHLFTDYLQQGKTPQEAVALGLKELEGAFAIAVLFSGYNDLMIVARRGSPLAIGYGGAGSSEMYVGSDALALAPWTDQITYLEEGDWAEISWGRVIIHDENDAIVMRKIQQTNLSGASIGKGEYRHFMLKEIFEQPSVVGETIARYVDTQGKLVLPKVPFDWTDISRLTIVACGTASYAGMVAKYWFEQLAGLPVDVDIASEFRYRSSPMMPGGAALFISQSGETADTLAALSYAKSKGQHILSVVNVAQSSMARLSDVVFPTLAGPEIGVASTKAFTTQLAVLLCLAVSAGLARKELSVPRANEILQALREVPSSMASIFRDEDRFRELAHHLSESRDVFYLGRGSLYPMALEGALKLKEISYIHAEGYPAGELKHGPIALIDDSVHVVVLAPHDSLFEKTASNIQEVVARSAKIILFSDQMGLASVGVKTFWELRMPKVAVEVAPILYAVPVQLLAYYTALEKGTDVDQPRNLAKSVTVE